MGPRFPVLHWRAIDVGALISDKLSRNSRIRVLKLKAPAGHRERDDGSALSSSPFFQLILFPSFLRRPSNSSEEEGQEGGAKEGEKKRETETRNCRTTYHHGASCTILSVNGVASSIIDLFLWTWKDLTRATSRVLHFKIQRVKLSSSLRIFYLLIPNCCENIVQFMYNFKLLHESVHTCVYRS